MFDESVPSTNFFFFLKQRSARGQKLRSFRSRISPQWLNELTRLSGTLRTLEPSQLRVLTLIRCPFHPRVTAVARKRPRSFCQNCRSQVNLNTHIPLTQRSRSGLTMPLSRHSVETYQRGNELTSNSSGNTRSSRLSLLSHCGLILA